MNIAMWSGPRNLSTAMMYAFASRSDTRVVDEPFYGAYLTASGLDHPMRDEIIASQSTDPEAIAAEMVSVSGKKALFYQKHMTHHMLPGFPLDWMGQVKNVFLIRHPARVVASYMVKREAPVLDDLGFTRQAALFDHARGLGQEPIVIDSADIRADPERMLAALCAHLGIGWDRAMLSWPAGGHAADGVWARHWYGAVHRSTGFAGPEGPLPNLAGSYADLADRAMAAYERLHALRLSS